VKNADLAPRYVIAMRDEEEGLLFWNNDNGFGDLASATVFTTTEARNYDLPFANNEPEWMELPA